MYIPPEYFPNIPPLGARPNYTFDIPEFAYTGLTAGFHISDFLFLYTEQKFSVPWKLYTGFGYTGFPSQSGIRARAIDCIVFVQVTSPGNFYLPHVRHVQIRLTCLGVIPRTKTGANSFDRLASNSKYKRIWLGLNANWSNSSTTNKYDREVAEKLCSHLKNWFLSKPIVAPFQTVISLMLQCNIVRL